MFDVGRKVLWMRTQNVKKELLFVSMCLPFDHAFHAGGKTFNYYIKQFVKDKFNVKLIAKVLPDEEKYIRTIDQKIDLYTVATPKNQIIKFFSYLVSLNSKFNPYYKYGNTLTYAIYRQIYKKLIQLKKDGYKPDVIVLEWTAILLFIDKIKEIFPNAVYVASEHDVTFLGYERKMKNADSILKKLYWKIAFNNIKKNEIKSIEQCDLVVTHNEKDKRLLIDNEIDEKKLGVITPYYDRFPIIDRCSNNTDIIFYGAMNRIENYGSAIWFIENVFPLLKKYNLKFIVIGSRPPKKLLDMQDEHIVVTGYVDDPGEYFKKAICLVAPLLLGAGVKVKIIEALSSGVPVLTNEIGIEGIDAENGREFFLCNTPEEYSKTIIDILDGRIDSSRISDNAQSLIREKYDLKKSYCEYKRRILNL